MWSRHHPGSKARGHKIFLDLKLHDIPNTVKGGMKNLAKLGVDIINCHCAGGIEMMKAAKRRHPGRHTGRTGTGQADWRDDPDFCLQGNMNRKSALPAM
jgi:hypothetical protein